jgi:alkanesulfonate monooxygenase SsuD/methylene tetrahydromethanopterin reductase-like flavin-dependent oxidoreductase (luciferase family)
MQPWDENQDGSIVLSMDPEAAATLELWTMRIPEIGTVVAQAERAEQLGWDGITFTDSQNLIGDPFVAVALAA